MLRRNETDLHAAPGKQNGDSHAGAPGPAKWFERKDLMEHTTRVLVVLLRSLTSFASQHSLPNLVALELVNEPAPSGKYNDLLESWYARTADALRSVDATIPLVLGDCWWPEHFVSACAKIGGPVALDHHLYRCFTPGDASTPASEHARRLRDYGSGAPAMLGSCAQRLEDAGGGLIVGEWSGALNPGSLNGAPDPKAAQREYVEAQLALYERVCAGWFFWTFKKQNPGDSGWGWRDAIATGVFPPWVGMRAARPVNAGETRHRMESARDKALRTCFRHSPPLVTF
jgi:glucan 1,3-beta-glucosidase